MANLSRSCLSSLAWLRRSSCSACLRSRCLRLAREHPQVLCAVYVGDITHLASHAPVLRVAQLVVAAAIAFVAVDPWSKSWQMKFGDKRQC